MYLFEMLEENMVLEADNKIDLDVDYVEEGEHFLLHNMDKNQLHL